MNDLTISLPNMLLESGSRLVVISWHKSNPRRRPKFFRGEDHMALFPTWVKNALVKFQYWTVELSRKRAEENALGKLGKGEDSSDSPRGTTRIEQD